MSFYTENKGIESYAPGWFLAIGEPCERLTYQFDQDGNNVETFENGGKRVPMGAVYPANDGTAIGIVYENVDVTSGDMPGSVVTKGTVYKDRLAVTLNTEAETALKAKGFAFIESPEVTRPY